jgi:dTDP-4-dehydrorhamnose reductase
MPEKQVVLITGSSGMLGSDLVKELTGKYEILGMDLADRSRLESSSFLKADITKQEEVSRIITNTRPGIVVHTAAWTDVDGCELDSKKAYSVNAAGTENVAMACSKAGAAMIYISTDFVFDGKKGSPYKEEDRPNPLSVYADSKFKGEEAVKRLLKKYFILRTSWLYGPNGNNFVDTIIAKAKENERLKVVDDQVGSPTYTADLAGAIRTFIDIISSASAKVTPGIYHVSNSGSVSWYEYANMILSIAGISAKVDPISSDELGRAAKRPAMSVLDCSKFTALTGLNMRSWDSALRDYLL